jgi:hypothetical protein
VSPDEQAPAALKVLERLRSGDEALLPYFWSLEILNSLLVAEKRGRISKSAFATLDEAQRKAAVSLNIECL